jgi:hypothetical protein
MAERERIKIMETLKVLRPEILKNAQKMRDRGSTFDQIARQISEDSGLSVSREVVRRYFAPDKVVDPELDGTGYVHD